MRIFVGKYATSNSKIQQPVLLGLLRQGGANTSATRADGWSADTTDCSMVRLEVGVAGATIGWTSGMEKGEGRD